MLLVKDAVPPPLLPLLKEKEKLKFGGEASVRTTGASEPSLFQLKINNQVYYVKLNH